MVREGVRVVAVFDDEPRRWHRRVEGVAVVGMPECLLNAGWRRKVDSVVLATEGRERAQELKGMLEGERGGGYAVWEVDGLGTGG